MDLNRFANVEDYSILDSPIENAAELDALFAVFEDLQVLNVILNREAQIAFLNNFGATTLNLSKERSRGMCWVTSFIPGEQRQELILGFEQIMDGNIEPYGTYCNDIVTVDGNLMPFKWTNHLLKTADGSIKGVCSFGSDSRGPVDDLAPLVDISFPHSIK